MTWTRQAVRHYDGRVVPGKDPMGRNHFWFTVAPIEQTEPGTDLWAMERGYISITPLSLDLTDLPGLDAPRRRAAARCAALRGTDRGGRGRRAGLNSRRPSGLAPHPHLRGRRRTRELETRIRERASACPSRRRRSAAAGPASGSPDSPPRSSRPAGAATLSACARSAAATPRSRQPALMKKQGSDQTSSASSQASVRARSSRGKSRRGP